MSKILIAADHRGYNLKEFLKTNVELTDYGTNSTESIDYPLLVPSVCKELQKNASYNAILICGSGVGMSIAANRFKGIYAALCWNKDISRKAKEDDNANILILPADFISNKVALDTVNSWLKSKFKGGKYQRRINQIDNIQDL